MTLPDDLRRQLHRDDGMSIQTARSVQFWMRWHF
jgi:hypothetical protein